MPQITLRPNIDSILAFPPGPAEKGRTYYPASNDGTALSQIRLWHRNARTKDGENEGLELRRVESGEWQ